MRYVIHQTYDNILALKESGEMNSRNVVKDIYAHFTEEEISQKITEILRPKDFQIPVEIVYQPLVNLPIAIPDHLGDWYFSGNYPTPGGNKIVNQSYLNFYDKIDARPYQVALSL